MWRYCLFERDGAGSGQARPRQPAHANETGRTMSKLIHAFIASQSGATAIEYSLIAAGIGLAIITAVQSVGVEVQGPFVDTATGLQKRVSP